MSTETVPDKKAPPNGQVEEVEAPLSLPAKLAQVMAEVGHVPKRGRNDFHKYDYVTEADLVDAVREKLAQRQVILLPSLLDVSEREVTSDKGKVSTVTTARVRFTFHDGQTGESLVCELAGQGDDPGDKGLYKAYTGALKYFVMKSFLIPTGDDPEGDKKADQRAQSRAKPDDSNPLSEDALEKLKLAVDSSGVDDKRLSMKLLSFGVDHFKDLKVGQARDFYAWIKNEVEKASKAL